MFFFSWKEQIFFCQLVRTVGFPLSQDFFNFQVPGLLDFFSPGTTGPSGSLSPVLSCPGTFPGRSRDVLAGPNPFFLHIYAFFFCLFFPFRLFFQVCMVSTGLEIKLVIIFPVLRMQLQKFATSCIFSFLFGKFLLANFSF